MFFPDFLRLERIKNNLHRASTEITNFTRAHPYALTTLFCLSLLAMAKAQKTAETNEEAEEMGLTCFNWLNRATSVCFQRYSDLTWRCLNNAAKFYGLSPDQMLACRSMAAENSDFSEVTSYDMQNECFTKGGDFRLLRDEDGWYRSP